MTRNRWAGHVLVMSTLAAGLASSCGGDEFSRTGDPSVTDAGSDLSQPEGSAGQAGGAGMAGNAGTAGNAGNTGMGGASATGGKAGNGGAAGSSHKHIQVTLVQGASNYSGNQTSWISQWDPAGAPNCPNQEFRVGYDNNYRGLIKFSLGTPLVPPSANINKAILRLFTVGWAGLDDAGVHDHVKVQVYGLRRLVDPCTANWNQAAAGVPWETAGCDGAGDRSTDTVVEVLVDEFNQWFEFDVTSLVKEWMAEPASNFGMILIPSDAYGMYIFAGDSAVVGIADRRPQLDLDLEI